MNIAFFAMGAWLILMGLVQAGNLQFQHRDKVMGVLAIVAGVIVLVKSL